MALHCGALPMRTGDDCLTTVQQLVAGAVGGGGARPRGDVLAVALPASVGGAHSTPCCCVGEGDLRSVSTSGGALPWSRRKPICVRDIDPRSGEVTIWASFASEHMQPCGALLRRVGDCTRMGDRIRGSSAAPPGSHASAGRLMAGTGAAGAGTAAAESTERRGGESVLPREAASADKAPNSWPLPSGHPTCRRHLMGEPERCRASEAGPKV
mmetsp:Transcript_143076/g.398662  ORF Transcript_143076/g.398662 Transcript_143076/m.398662 type:complete len:212 (+) Transcript_143076:329-964(+)